MDIKDIRKQKEVLEKRIFNMIKKFADDHKIIITDINFWADEDNILNNITLTTRFEEDVDRRLKLIPKEDDNGITEK